MSKIICDVCGTRYPDSAEQCPICGRVRTNTGNVAADEVEFDETEVRSHTSVRGGRFSKSNVRKRQKNQPAYEEEQEDWTKTRAKAKQEAEEAYDPYEEYEEEPENKSGTVLNVLLVIVIIALLAVSAYIFVQFFMPGLTADQQPAPATDPVAAVTENVTEEPTEEPTVPCAELILNQDEVLTVDEEGGFHLALNEPGAMYLLNVAVSPVDTTDTLMYSSGNEEVATVNTEGRVTAVGEGETVIYIACGTQTLECNVKVSAVEATEEPTEEPTQAPTEDPDEGLKDVTLSLKQSDVTFRAQGQQATFKLTCDLKASEVTWVSEDEDIVTVDENGVVTRVGKGTTHIIVTYGSQEVKVIVRCP